jgi:hypothetical protein
MLQRVQSLYLLFACLVMVLMWVFPYWSISDPEHQMIFSGLSLKSYGPEEEVIVSGPAEDIFQLLLNLLIALSVLSGLILIFMFQNRIKQATFCVLLMVLHLLTGSVAGWMVLKTESALTSAGAVELSSSFQAGSVFPMVALALTWMARRSILKDEALVKSMDRIR